MFDLAQTVCRITGAGYCKPGEKLQELWSGYGVIQRVHLALPSSPTAIVKHIDLSRARKNRRGWSGDASHDRKVKSYGIEKHFYEVYAPQCSGFCRVPELLGACQKPDGDGYVLVLEDLDAAGFHLRKQSIAPRDLDSCLRWLANFHSRFIRDTADPIATDATNQHWPDGLWSVGTYWHLETRQDELQAMEGGPLKQLAAQIDRRLNRARFKTLVHGDAKIANFCFHGERPQVAAVDFQYVGGGCGMKDVAYLMSSCLDGPESEARQNELLDIYFAHLRTAMTDAPPASDSETMKPVDIDSLESEWRALYRFAWADFCRFLAGWSPGHWKLNEYNDRVTQKVLRELAG